MIPKIYRARRCSHLEAQRSFEESYRYHPPSSWSDFQIRQVAHIIKWSSVGFNLRETIKLSKSLLARELGQRGYVKHINMVYPIVQGHSLGAGQITTYDYRSVLKQLVRWIKEQGSTALDEFKLVLRATCADIESSHRKKMGWFWKLVSSWFLTFKAVIKQALIDKRSNVTTIQESSIILSSKERLPSAEKQAEGSLAGEDLHRCLGREPRPQREMCNAHLSTHMCLLSCESGI